MGYFNKYLRTLYDELEDVLGEDDSNKFHYLIEQQCTLESVPTHFILLIDLAVLLLQKIREQPQEKKKCELLNAGKEIHNDFKVGIKTKSNERISIINEEERLKSSGITSTIAEIPLQMVSTSFRYFPFNDSIFAQRFGNQLLLNAALNYLESCSDVEVTFDPSKICVDHSDEKVNMKSKRITSIITQLHFIKMDGNVLTETVANMIVKTVNICKNIVKISLEGRFSFLSLSTNLLSSTISKASMKLHDSLYEAIEKCPNLRHIEFISNKPHINEKLKELVVIFHQKFSGIELITLNAGGEVFTHKF